MWGIKGLFCSSAPSDSSMFAQERSSAKIEKINEKETMTRVVANISLMISRWKDMDVIYVSYHIQ